MNIVMAGDAYVLSGIELVIYSAMLHNKNINWYILTMSVEVDDEATSTVTGYCAISEESQNWLKFMVHFMDKNSTITFIDTRELYDEFLSNSVNRTTSFTPYAALRLLIDMALPDLNRCLYLDADTIVQGSLQEMYDRYTKIHSEYAAYVVPSAKEGFGEMISAVLVMNLDRMRETHFLDRARYFYNTVKSVFPDQAAISLVAEPVKLEETYGYLEDHRKCPYKPIILHFTNVNYKIYSYDNRGEWYRMYPEHLYLKNGIDMVFEIYSIYKISK